MTIRTRFAPSPTGYLHVGGARTALYCWLYAKNKQGKFILRIEDTDLERSTKEAKDAILESMAWLGLTYDEGPIYQTDRFARYDEIAHKLLEQGKAYRCYCSKERLEKLREDLTAAKEKPRYDGHCRNITNGDPSQPHVIRFKNPETGSVIFDDAVRGIVETKNDELDDLIIVRTDGAPTYNFSVVVDDSDMEIDIVIRGEDHIANTPRQINILQALGAKIPQYAHIPMILGGDGKRLSKRHGAVSVMQYHDDGYLPQALLNYLVRLGWSHGDQEIFSQQEMIDSFDLQHISKSPAAFNTEKLNWLNQHYMKTLPAAEVAEYLKWQLQQLGLDYTQGPALEAVVAAQCERVKTTKEMAERSKFLFVDDVELDPEAVAKHLTAAAKPALELLQQKFSILMDWTAPTLHAALTEVATELNVGMGKIGPPLRVAVTGNTMSPSIDLTLQLIGKTRVLSRIDSCLKILTPKEVMPLVASGGVQVTVNSMNPERLEEISPAVRRSVEMFRNFLSANLEELQASHFEAFVENSANENQLRREDFEQVLRQIIGAQGDLCLTLTKMGKSKVSDRINLWLNPGESAIKQRGKT